MKFKLHSEVTVTANAESKNMVPGTHFAATVIDYIEGVNSPNRYILEDNNGEIWEVTEDEIDNTLTDDAIRSDEKNLS